MRMPDRLADALRTLADAIRAEIRDGLAEQSQAELLSIPDAAARMGVGRTTVYAELASGRLRSIRVGRRRLIPADAIQEYVKEV